MQFSELVAAVRDQGGFDTSSTGSTAAEIKSWVNEAYKRMVVRSKWRKAQIQLALTVAGEDTYAVPELVEDIIDGLEIDGEAIEWESDYADDGTAQIVLGSAPDTTGTPITALCALAPPPLVSDTDVPIVPGDFHDALVDGAIGTGMRRVEERIQEADSYDARFLDETEKLRRRGNMRLKSGPAILQVEGYRY